MLVAVSLNHWYPVELKSRISKAVVVAELANPVSEKLSSDTEYGIRGA